MEGPIDWVPKRGLILMDNNDFHAVNDQDMWAQPGKISAP
jgi:hypothetical protein